MRDFCREKAKEHKKAGTFVIASPDWREGTDYRSPYPYPWPAYIGNGGRVKMDPALCIVGFCSCPPGVPLVYSRAVKAQADLLLATVTKEESLAVLAAFNGHTGKKARLGQSNPINPYGF